MTHFDTRRFDLLAVLLAPAVRYCLRSAIGAYDLLEVLKALFVRFAIEEIEKNNNKVTISRLAAMTGIQRREVKRLEKKGGWSFSGYSNLTTRIIGQWEQDPRFLTKSREPRSLSYRGKNSGFEDLVMSVSSDIGPASVLFDLERLGLVERLGNRVKLKRSVNIHQQRDSEKGYSYISQNAETLVNAAEENIFENPEIKNLHLRTVYDNIDQSDLPLIRKWLIKQGSAFHKQAREFLSTYDLDINPSPGKCGSKKVVITAFSWTSPLADQLNASSAALNED